MSIDVYVILIISMWEKCIATAELFHCESCVWRPPARRRKGHLCLKVDKGSKVRTPLISVHFTLQPFQNTATIQVLK